MKVKCLKNSFMYGFEGESTEEQTFSEGKEYEIIADDEDDGFCVIDDSGDDHWIYKPGDKFFDENFEILECPA